jgi:hypothetical protein
MTKVPVPFLNKGQTRNADRTPPRPQEQGLGPQLAAVRQEPGAQSAGTVGGDGASAPAPDAKPAKPETPPIEA